jgi:hypothetical protein
LRRCRWLAEHDDAFVASDELAQHLQAVGPAPCGWFYEVAHDALAAGCAAVLRLYVRGQQLGVDLPGADGGDSWPTLRDGVAGMLRSWLWARELSYTDHSAALEVLGAVAEMLRARLHRPGGCDAAAPVLAFGGTAQELLWPLVGKRLGGSGRAVGATHLLDGAVVMVLGPMLALGMRLAVPGELRWTRCRLPSCLGSLLVTAAAESGQASSSGQSAELAINAARCLEALARCDDEMRKDALHSVQRLPAAISSMLAAPELAGPGLDLLHVMAGRQRKVQGLLAGEPGLLQGLAGLLAGLAGGAVKVRALQVLRTLVLGNAAAQLAFARLPGAGAAIAALLGSEEGGEEGEVANEAAETLAVLQHDSEGARELVRAAARGVQLQLQL